VSLLVSASDRALCARVAALMVVATTLGALGGGCSQLLGITNITAAPDSGTDAADGGADAARDTPAEPRDASSPLDVPTAETPPVDGSPPDVPDASPKEAGVDAAPCTQDLSGIKNGGFYISFTLQTTQTNDVVALVSQRDVCSNGIFWELELVNQQLYLEVSDRQMGSTILRSSTGMPLNDGQSHAIVVSRVDGRVQLTVDGVPSRSAMANQSFGDGELGPLRSGTSVCPESGTGTAPLDRQIGSITNLCVRPQ
jgi:hypothetical protein